MKAVVASVVCFMLVLSLTGISLVFPEPSYACSCIRPGPPSEALEESAMVFEGKVISVRRYERPDGTWTSADPVTVEFEVEAYWKGYDYQTLYLTTPRSDGSCGFRFVVGEDYLVYSPNAVTVNICSRTRSISEAEEDLEELGEGQYPTPGTVGLIPAIPDGWIEVLPSPETPGESESVVSASTSEAVVPTPGRSDSPREKTPIQDSAEGAVKVASSPETSTEEVKDGHQKEANEEPTRGGCSMGSVQADLSIAGMVAGLAFLGFRRRRLDP